MKKMRLRWLMVLWIWGATMALFLILLYAQFSYSKKYVIDELEDEARNLAKYYSRIIESGFSESRILAHMLSIYMETNIQRCNEKELSIYLQKILQENTGIYGIGVAFEPYAFDASKRRFAPYYYRKDGKITYVELGKDDDEYFQRYWYRLPKEKMLARWTDPYFDEEKGETVLISYVSPFYYNGIHSGFAIVSISLDQLIEEINAIKILNTGYGFLISKSGLYLAFPDKKRILKGNIFENNREWADKMLSGQINLISGTEPMYGKKSWIVTRNIKSPNLVVGFVYPENEILHSVYTLQKRTAFIGFIGLTALLIVIILISNSISQPVTQLAQKASLAAKSDFKFQIDADSSTSEVQALANSINKMVADLNAYIEEIRNITAEKERIESELEVAHKIQMSAIPATFPARPDWHNVDVYAKIKPAREVGGDFYDIFSIDQDRLGFMIGDASGKGVPAALYMAVSRALLRAAAMRGFDPGESLQYANKLLCSENYADMFITVFYGILNVHSGELTFCNGGHSSPILFRKGKIEFLEADNGLPPGIELDCNYKTETVSEVDGIFLYTDGATEAKNEKGDFFSDEKLMQIVRKLDAHSAKILVSSVMEEVDKYSAGAPQADDITLMMIRRIRSDLCPTIGK